MQYRPPRPQEFNLQTPRDPSAEETLIHERVMGRCIHRDHRVEFERDRDGEACVAVCANCEVRTEIDFKPRGSRYFPRSWPPSEQPADFMKHLVPHYAADVVIARKIVRHLESKGWRGTLREERARYRYTITKGDAKFASAFESTEAGAICGAAVALGRSGRLFD